jgi:6-pyruvoyltetrahydropterin/6-carboxytetrahydropterin synthase
MFQVSVEAHFDAAHWLPGYDGECAELHGHRWYVALTLNIHREETPEAGFFVDFKVLKQALNEAIGPLDHSTLNETVDNPTAENLAKYIFQRLEVPILQNRDVEVEAITVHETPGTTVTYSPSAS